MMNSNQTKKILNKLSIDKLTPMQEEAILSIQNNNETIIVSPTGTGKTLAFLLPILASLDTGLKEVQALIIAPSRELAIQIETVARNMGTGSKINAVYGGRSFSSDKINIKHQPALLIGTPGRIADHFRRGTIDTDYITTLVLDEFDKSLEVGFEEEISEILNFLTEIKKTILCSATQGLRIPNFVKLSNPKVIDYLGSVNSALKIKRIVSPVKDKMQTLGDALCHLGDHPGIIFCNYRDSIDRVSDYLSEIGINHACFYGGMEQKDRERSLIKFRNGTHKLLLATDLAARGIDVPEIAFIIHYHLPHKAEEFIHRNGRTARMHSNGMAFVLHWVDEELPDFIPESKEEEIKKRAIPSKSDWLTLFISGGRRDKISKGDIAGLFFKQGKLKKDQIGIIELKEDCAFVAVSRVAAKSLIPLVDNMRLKKKKVRISIV